MCKGQFCIFFFLIFGFSSFLPSLRLTISVSFIQMWDSSSAEAWKPQPVPLICIYYSIAVAAEHVCCRVRLSSCLAGLLSQTQWMRDGLGCPTLHKLSQRWEDLKSPHFRGHPGQLNNRQPVIMEPSPDVDFPFLGPVITPHKIQQRAAGWSLYMEHLPLHISTCVFYLFIFPTSLA